MLTILMSLFTCFLTYLPDKTLNSMGGTGNHLFCSWLYHQYRAHYLIRSRCSKSMFE